MSVNRLVKYRFRFVYNSIIHGNVDQVIYPKYDDKFTLTTESEPKEYYYRTQTSYSFLVTREDYQLIFDSPFDEDLEIILESNLNGAGWVEKWKGVFNYTDLDIDEDKKKLRFTAETDDSYKPILDNWNREFNLFDLNIPTEDIEYLQKGLIQFYVLGTDVVTNYVSNGQYFEQSVNSPTQDHSKLTTENHFSPLGDLKYWVSGSGEISPDVSGYYTYNGVTFKYENGLYEVDFIDSSRVFTVNTSIIHDFDDYNSVWAVGGVNFVFKGIIRIGGEIKLYFFRQGASNSAPTTGTLTHVSGATNTADIIYTETDEMNEDDGIRRSIRLLGGGDHKFIGPTFKGSAFEFSNASGVIMESLDNSDKCSLHIASVLARVLTNEETIDGQTVLTLPNDDIVDTNYKFALKPSSFDGVHFSDEHSSTSGYFGKYASNAPNHENEYYVRPTSISDLIPLAQSTWKYASMWFKVTPELSGLSLVANSRKVAQAFKLDDVLKSLLGEFSTVTFEPDVNHSSFLYSTNNPISTDARKDIYICPKSNITNVGYDVAASKANIKFKDLIDNLKIIFHSGWHIDANDRFRIEHSLWYWYGGQNTAPLISFDLTNLTLPRNGKPWSFGTNKYNFEKNRIPSRSTFGWMDNSSDVFEGYPIEFTDKYVDKAYIEDNPVTIFSTDIEAMISNPNNFSKEGFVIFDVDEYKQINSEWILYKGINMNIQNGRFTFPYIHKSFYKKPSKAGRTGINGGEDDVFTTTIERNKIQPIEFPLSLPTFDPIQLIKSNQGDGKIDSMIENILTHEIKVKLRHDTKK